MAIEKVENAPKVEWTAATLIHLGVSFVLVVLSGVFGWLGFANWRFKANLVEGYQEYDRGRPSTAKKSLEAALEWRKDHKGARELLAKILCDEGSLDSARKHYQTLAAQGYHKPQVHIGLGVLALKEVEPADKPKQIEALVSEAAGEFKRASGVPEAEIGLGHCDLVLGRKLANPAYYTRAEATFKKIRQAMETKEFASQITRDGLVDYYTGVGKALSAGEKVDEGAAAAFRSCYLYTPTWSLPMANVLLIEARRFANFTEGNDALLKLQPDLNALRSQARIIWNAIRDPKEKEAFREAWMTFNLALAQAWGRAGNVNEMGNIVRDLTQGSGADTRLDPFILEAQVRTELAVKDDPIPASQEQHVSRASTSYADLVQRIPTDDANRERRAIAFNNSAWTLTWRGGYLGNEGMHMQAVQRLTEALRAYPDDYVYNRNMAIILKRFRKPPSAPQAYVDKCRAAVAKDKELAEDFEKLQKYMETK